MSRCEESTNASQIVSHNPSVLSLALLATVPVQFVDATERLGLKLDTNAACWADLNRDGWPDLVAGGGIWINQKGVKFEKVGEAMNCVAADFDNDGFNDLFSWSSLKLYRNVDGKSFIEHPLPILPKCISRGAAWADFDGNGFVDLYVGGFEDGFPGTNTTSFTLLNDKGTFRVTNENAAFRTRGVTTSDYDQDGDQDVYVSNYRLQPNRLLIGDGKGGFVDEAATRNAVATSPGFGGGHSIGAAWGDFDADGRIDLFAGNFAHVDSRGDQPKSRFLRSQGPDKAWAFEDKGTCGVFYQESYATPSAADYDNDGHLDLFFTTVYADASFGKKNFPVLFRGNGAFAFIDETSAARLANLPPTYQAAWADFDRDGDLDLASGGKLFANQGAPGRNWLGVRLEGSRKVNRSAVGAQVRLLYRGRTLTRQVEAGTGEGNQNDLTLHFGLGTGRGPVNLEITWPGGRKQRAWNVAINQMVNIQLLD